MSFGVPDQGARATRSRDNQPIQPSRRRVICRVKIERGRNITKKQVK